MRHIKFDLLYDLLSAEAISNPAKLPYYAEQLDSQGILQARRLLADVYVRKNVITKDALTPNGTMNKQKDPYWRHSIYYGVRDKRDPTKLLISARLIKPTALGVDSLQVHLDEFNQDARQQIYAADPRTIAEFAAYVKQPGLDPVESRIVSLYLIRQMITDSRRRGIKTWIFGLRPELRSKYERVFGVALERCGNQVHLGAFTSVAFIPYRVDVERSWQQFVQASKWRLGSRAIANFIGSAYANSTSTTPHSK